MKTKTTLLVVGLALVCLTTFIACEGLDGKNKTDVDLTPKSARARFQLPKLFDFERFKYLFKKSYGSLVEELARKKIVLANAFRALITSVKYKYGRLSHFFRVNILSDQTPAELAKLQMNPKRAAPVAKDTPVAAASEEDVEQVIESIQEHKGEPGFEKIIEQLDEAGVEIRKKRSVVETRDISVDDLIAEPIKESAEDEVAMVAEKTEQSSLPYSLMTKIKSLSGVNFLSSLVLDATATLAAPSDPLASDKSTLEDVVYVDHRLSNCFNPARYQYQCGCCYSFATIALYEWDYCRQYGQRVAFSEQYLVDCGPVSGLSEGCDGGNLPSAVKFVDMFGLEMRDYYPYVARKDQCPHGPGTPPGQIGYIRQKEQSMMAVGPDQFDYYLTRSPILTGIWSPTYLTYYGGGVDEALDCVDGVFAHAMLIVGSGREDGKEYYLFRNSYSDTWGENGYYKISKEAFRRCISGGTGQVSVGAWKGQSLSMFNPSYNFQPINMKYQAYMAEMYWHMQNQAYSQG